MIEYRGIYLCDYPSWYVYMGNLKVRTEAKFAQINSALFPFAPISSRTVFSLKVLP